MNYRNISILTLAALLLSGGAGEAAGQCKSVKLYRRCNPNADYSFCNGDLMCQAQADATATSSTCYLLQVPCTFNENDLGDTAFAFFQYPIVGKQYNVPREMAK